MSSTREKHTRRPSPANRWVRMSQLIPWAVFVERYAALFSNPREVKPAKSARMAINSLIIKKRYGFSDEDVVEEIRENPYLQYFLASRNTQTFGLLTPAR
ncbi:MAG: transposase [Christensenellales bacterium]|jgi:IS5 family transposase